MAGANAANAAVSARVYSNETGACLREGSGTVYFIKSISSSLLAYIVPYFSHLSDRSCCSRPSLLSWVSLNRDLLATVVESYAQFSFPETLFHVPLLRT